MHAKVAPYDLGPGIRRDERIGMVQLKIITL
jgi:hypothetical protein